MPVGVTTATILSGFFDFFTFVAGTAATTGVTSVSDTFVFFARPRCDDILTENRIREFR
jgi:hypothetical protein